MNEEHVAASGSRDLVGNRSPVDYQEECRISERLGPGLVPVIKSWRGGDSEPLSMQAFETPCM